VRDQRLLLLSVWVSAGFAVVSSVWGILSGSSMIVFDGLYSFASVGLSVLAVMALRFARRGADERFPWGREAAEPVVVIVKAGILAALCVYAAVQGVVDIVAGGRDIEVGWAILYAVLAAIGAGDSSADRTAATARAPYGKRREPEACGVMSVTGSR